MLLNKSFQIHKATICSVIILCFDLIFMLVQYVFFLVFCSHDSLSNMYRVLTVVTPFMERYSSHRNKQLPSSKLT